MKCHQAPLALGIIIGAAQPPPYSGWTRSKTSMLFLWLSLCRREPLTLEVSWRILFTAPSTTKERGWELGCCWIVFKLFFALALSYSFFFSPSRFSVSWFSDCQILTVINWVPSPNWYFMWIILSTLMPSSLLFIRRFNAGRAIPTNCAAFAWDRPLDFISFSISSFSRVFT